MNLLVQIIVIALFAQNTTAFRELCASHVDTERNVCLAKQEINVCLDKMESILFRDLFVFFGQNESSINYYVIHTSGVLTGFDYIHNELKKHNLTIFKSNPLNDCGWTTIVNGDQYDLLIHNVENENLTAIGYNILINRPTAADTLTLILLILLFPLSFAFIIPAIIHVCLMMKPKKYNLSNAMRESESYYSLRD